MFMSSEGFEYVSGWSTFVQPDRQRGDVDASLQEHIEGNVCHCQLRRQEPLAFTVQQNSDVRIAIGQVRISHTAAEEYRLRYVIVTGNTTDENARRFRCLGVNGAILRRSDSALITGPRKLSTLRIFVRKASSTPWHFA